jgi:type I restriction-modification system DNA methylase subunit
MPLSKQQLGSLLWGIADTGLRGKVEDYKSYILSLLFFKRLSDSGRHKSGSNSSAINTAKSQTRNSSPGFRRRAMRSLFRSLTSGLMSATPHSKTRTSA